MHTYIKTKINSLLIPWSGFSLISAVSIAVALCSLMGTPWIHHGHYGMRAIIIALCTIAWVIFCQFFSIKNRYVLFGLLTVGFVDIGVYNATLHRDSKMFATPFPKKFLLIGPNRYQSIRTSPYTKDYFQRKTLDAIYGVTGSYLQDDFCPALRQDMISTPLRNLFVLRESQKVLNIPPIKSIGYVSEGIVAQGLGGHEYDIALRHTLGCDVPKLRLMSHVQYAYNASEAAALASKIDIYKTPVVLLPPNTIIKKVDSTLKQLDYNIQTSYFSANKLQLTVENNTLSTLWLVYADSYNKHWSAFVDGKQVPLFVANIAFKGLQVPSGQHSVLFQYKKPLTWVYIFSGMMCIIAIGILSFLIWLVVAKSEDNGVD